MRGLASLLACMAFCLVAVLAIFISSGRREGRFGLPGQLPPREHQLPADQVGDRYRCPMCPTAYTDVGTLIVHEIQDHPADTWRS